jgi:hypothetical protein
MLANFPNSAPVPVNVVIVEDGPGLLDALCRITEATPDMRPAGAASKVAEGLAMLPGSRALGQILPCAPRHGLSCAKEKK